MVIKYKNVLKDYLEHTVKQLEKKRSNFIYSVIDDKAYFSDGHIVAILNASMSPFKERDNAPDISKMIYKYDDKRVYISNERIVLSGIECYVLKDEFDNVVTYINKKMVDRWFDINDIKLCMQNLDNKSPVFFHYGESVIGLVLPIRKVV